MYGCGRMSNRQRSELELRYLEAMRHLAFRFLTRREEEPEPRESDPWESTRSDDVDAVLRMIQSLGNEIRMIGMLDGKDYSDERNGR